MRRREFTGIIARARAADPRTRTNVMRNPVIMRNPRCEPALPEAWRPTLLMSVISSTARVLLD